MKLRMTWIATEQHGEIKIIRRVPLPPIIGWLGDYARTLGLVDARRA